MTPDLLERTRMALAEAGYDPSLAHADEDGRLIISGGVPYVDKWRAWSVATATANQMCMRCAEPATRTLDLETVVEARARCLADRPLVRDCGVTR